jgi:hypothetical protein
MRIYRDSSICWETTHLIWTREHSHSLGERKMLWRKKESLPWYRAPNYKGDLTEDEKRELDLFRYRAERHGIKHPAATYDDLPEEVGSYKL